jgi:hypothetical protein
MKNKLISVFDRIWNFRKHRKFSGFTKRLQQAIKKDNKASMDKYVDQIILKAEIQKYMRKYLGIGARSKYIPKRFKNDEESRQQVLSRYGGRMETLGITIDENLKLCTQ